MDRLRLLFILPLAVSVMANVATTLLCKSRVSQWTVLIVSVLVSAGCLRLALNEVPELVCVPDFKHKWRDEAALLCKKQGLRMIPMPGTYGKRGGEVQIQNLDAGSLVARASRVELRICLGEPVPDPLFGLSKSDEPTK